jgi:hypothetical protein
MRSLIATLFVSLAFSSVALAQDFEAAGRHFSAAQEAFGAKHFKTAAAEFEAAYAITKDPVLLYNIGESYEKAGEGRKAVASYKAYLKEQQKASDKAEVQKRIRAIDAKHGKLVDQSAPGDNPPTATSSTAPATPPPTSTAPATPAPSTPGKPTAPATTQKEPGPSPPSTAPPSTAPPSTSALPPSPPPVESAPTPEKAPAPVALPPEPAPVQGRKAAEPAPGLIDEGPPSKMRIAAWIGVAATLATLTAGAIFGLSAQSRADEINRRLSFVDMTGQPHKFDQSAAEDLNSLKSDGELYNSLAISFYSIAAASAVVTVSLFIVDARRPKKERAWNLTPVVGRNAGGFAVGGRF